MEPLQTIWGNWGAHRFNQAGMLLSFTGTVLMAYDLLMMTELVPIDPFQPEDFQDIATKSTSGRNVHWMFTGFLMVALGFWMQFIAAIHPIGHVIAFSATLGIIAVYISTKPKVRQQLNIYTGNWIKHLRNASRTEKRVNACDICGEDILTHDGGISWLEFGNPHNSSSYIRVGHTDCLPNDPDHLRMLQRPATTVRHLTLAQYQALGVNIDAYLTSKGFPIDRFESSQIQKMKRLEDLRLGKL